MNIQETLESANIISDSKARRVLNTAPDKQADITLKEIEQGVTIERLETLTVPVYQYGTQITIHGTFTDMPNDRVLGYKALFLNQNKSLGVKYVAIDGAKKQLLLHVSRYSKTKWGISIDSEGLKAFRMFWTTNNPNHDKQDCIDCYKSTPDDLYIGGKQACAMVYGGYAVIVGIGAIYQANLWALIKWFTGIESQEEYETLEKLAKIKREKESAKYEAQRKIELEVKQAELNNAMANFQIPSNWQVYQGKIETVGTFARLRESIHVTGIVLQVIKTAKRGGRLCANSKEFPDLVFQDWQPSHYKEAHYKIDGWQILDKPVKTAQTLENKGMASETDGITITHNEKLNGIEIAFKTKPSNTVLDMLRANGFRWSYKSMLWYARYNQELMNKMQNELIGDKELCNVL